MLFLVVFSVLSFLNLGTEAVQNEEIPKFYREIEGKEEISKCSDITPLLNKLISELESMKGQILHEMPEQLEKQGLEMKKMGNDLEKVKGLIKANANKTDISIAKISDLEEADAKQTEDIKNVAKDIRDIKNCCTKQANQSKNNHVYLRRIETSVDNVAIRAKQISESLQVHDQRLQNFSNRDLLNQRDCSDIKRMGFRSNGVYRIYLSDNAPKDVYCDFSTPGGDWLVFQRRKDGSVDFYRNWKHYSDGFGNPNGEFWLGNGILNQITSNRKYTLRIDLEDFENQKRYAEYSSFSIGPSSDYYRLRIGNYSGNAGDSLTHHNNQQFSTPDVERDQHPSLNCAANYCQGSWWFNNCHYSNLNGRYWRGAYSGNPTGVIWHHWRGHYYSLKATEMKIARLQ